MISSQVNRLCKFSASFLLPKFEVSYSSAEAGGFRLLGARPEDHEKKPSSTIFQLHFCSGSTPSLSVHGPRWSVVSLVLQTRRMVFNEDTANLFRHASTWKNTL
jgi:hypothetical protein